MQGYVSAINCGECAKTMHVEVEFEGIVQPTVLTCGTPGCGERGKRYLAPRTDLTEAQ